MPGVVAPKALPRKAATLAAAVQPLQQQSANCPFSRWSKTGGWERVFQHLAEDADNEYAMIDATIVRAHQHSAGAKGGSQKPKRLVAARAD